MANPIDNYRQEVREAIRARTGTPIFNGSVEHAAAIAQEAFTCAQHDVSILTYKLDPDCYTTEVQNAARFFLADPNHTLRILVESELWDKEKKYNWAEHPFLKSLTEFSKCANGGHEAQLTIKRVPDSWLKRYKFNFLLFDNYGYRYEADRNVTAAVAAFLPDGQKTKMASMEKFFGDIWNSRESEAIALD